MDPGDGQVPVLLTWAADEQAVEVRGEAPPGDVTWTPVLGELARFARDVLDLAPTSPVHARLFQCHPDDLSRLDGAARRFTDGRGYARAFAHDAQGDFVVNARYREVPTAPATVNPAAVTRLVSEANTQAALQRIEARLEHVEAAVESLIALERLTFQAESLTVVELVDAAWQTYRLSGAVSYTDWDRIAPVEVALRKNYRVVLGELDRVAASLSQFTNVRAARLSLDIEPTYVRNLVALEQHLLRAIAQHVQLSLAVRADRGEPVAVSETMAVRDLAQFRAASESIYERLKSLDPQVVHRPGLGTFLRSGLMGMNWEKEIVGKACDNVVTVRRQIPSRPRVTSWPQLRIVRADAS